MRSWIKPPPFFFSGYNPTCVRLSQIICFTVLFSEQEELLSLRGSEEKQHRWVDRAGGVDGQLACSKDYVQDSDPQLLEYPMETI